ncbi:exonuclease SbcCD subunit D [Falsihalocynthiibacter sp. BN13B15]|uniref:metallophosphoesterase family protein n=1 Tax=Falsihalocynthiibacter sp. BN13B15 TaxID=3240871 RepID=UPI00351089A9
MRFVHVADFHLGKPFGNFDEDTRAALKAARLDALQATGALAVSRNAEFVVIAGDTFDAEAPPSRLVKRALDAMAAFPDLTWIWMPGNHDSLAAVDLWERLERDKPANVILATSADVIDIGPNVAILPAPPSVRASGYDLTEWMGTADTGTRIRIGLAHGGVTDFGSEDGGLATIPPDRAETSNLDYLALGDWHGQMRITSRTWYAGGPEADGFKGHAPAGALVVEIDKHGEAPCVEQVPLGKYTWHRIEVEFFSGIDPVTILEEALPKTGRDFALVRFIGTGRLGLSDLAALRKACEKLEDEFHFFEANLVKVGIEQNVDDLNLIAEAGALRVAAESIFEATSIEGRTEEDARIAQIALSHLFFLAQETAT